MTILTSFSFFPLLPIELKLRIYHMALGPRTVPVRLKLDLNAWNWSTEKDWWTCYSVVADPDSQRTPLPAVLSARYEAWEELRGLYSGLKVERLILETLLGVSATEASHIAKSISVDTAISPPSDHTDNPGKSEDVSARRLVENLLSPGQEHGRPPFNPGQDILAWRDTRRWISCGDAQLRNLVHPLFLASCLSVRYVRIEYTPCMANLLEVLAFSVLDARRPLEGLDLSVRNPSDCRVLRFRLCRAPERARISGARMVAGEVMGEDVPEKEKVEDMVRQCEAVWFPWSRGRAHLTGNVQRQGFDPLVQQALEKIASLNTHPASPEPAPAPSPLTALLADAPLETANTAILQVLAASDPTTGPGASGTWARAKALMDPSRFKFQYTHLDEPLRFGLGNLQTDILLWCHAMKLHGAGYPANLPFDIVGLPCHGFCGEGYGMGG